MSERIKKVNELLKRELGKIILKEVDLPKSTITTIIKVETSKDLDHCKVFISVIPQKETKKALRILNQQAYRIHQVLNKRLFIKRVPKIRFSAEKELPQAQKVDAILNSIKEETRG